MLKGLTYIRVEYCVVTVLFSQAAVRALGPAPAASTWSENKNSKKKIFERRKLP